MPTLRYAGFAEEAGFNEDPAPAAQFHVDIASASLDSPTETEMIYEGGLGRGVRTHRPGAYAPEGDVAYAGDIRTLGWMLKWALGGYVFTPGVDPALNTHEIYGVNENILASFAAFLGKDVFEHRFHGCVMTGLTIESENEWVTVTPEIVAAKDSKAAIEAIADLILPAEYPLAFHDVTVQREASDVSAKVKAWTLSIANNADAEAGMGQGSRHPYRIPVFEREITIEATLYFEGTEELERFWGGATGPTITGAEEFGMTFNLDAGADGTLDIAAPRIIYTSVPQQPDGRSEITQDVGMTAFVTTHTLADGLTEVESELLCTLQNTQDEMVAAI